MQQSSLGKSGQWQVDRPGGLGFSFGNTVQNRLETEKIM